MRVAIVIALLAAAAVTACAQDSVEEKPPIKLSASSSTVLASVGSDIHSLPQCDADGNLYSQVGIGVKHTAISRVPLDGPTVLYTVNADDANNLYFVDFYVTRHQQIWELMGGTKDDQPYVFRFKSAEPTKSDRIKLDAPEGITASTVKGFVVLPKDNILLMGYFGKKAPQEKQGHSYLAEFDSSGKLLRTILQAATSEAIAYAAKWAADTAGVYQSDDGTTYMLQQDKILVLSASGDVMRTIPLAPAQKNYQANHIYMNRGRLVVAFYGPDAQPGKPLTTRYALVDASSGEIIRWYEPDEELGNAVVSFSDDGLVFLRIEKGRIKLVTAAIK